ncbi:hypothetical protein [Microbacterium jejuense]|uniref:hypothetical protein n=1 Tax=Microbacterium jejuense TaxID=1263637 RepID=UPI0031EEDF33
MRPLVLLRTHASVMLGCLPLLALLLVPQLMRSRAGSESLLMAGVLALLVVLTAAVILAPVMSAFAAPGDGWRPRTALGATRRVWRTRRAQAWLALGLSALLYAAGQVAGYALAEVVPYVHDNPAAAGDPTASPWIIDYPAYALQAAVIYLFTTLALAVYAVRLRSLATAAPVSAPAPPSGREQASAAGA